MLNKLALQNARRLWKDYLNYFLTLCMITALMFAFHSLLFSEDIDEIIHYGNSGEPSTAGMMLLTFMSVATTAILFITAWLINYMTRFILEKRSREFAVYLLAGMKKKQIADLYMKENFCLGISALLAGILLGSGLQQALLFIFYKSIGKNYEFVRQSTQAKMSAFSLTVILYGICFFVALSRNRGKFSRMEIIGLIHMDKQNEVVKEKRNALWEWLFFLSAGNIIIFYLLIFTGKMTKMTAIFEMIAQLFTFYCFYLGLSAFL